MKKNEAGLIELIELTTSIMKDNYSNKDKENFTDLFEYNDFNQIFQNIQKVKFFKKESINHLSIKENELCMLLNDNYSKLFINIDKNVSKISMNHNSKIFFQDIANLAFDRFFLNMDLFDGVENVYIQKEDTKLYIHFIGVGKEQISFQKIITENGVENRQTLLFNSYNTYITPISEETLTIIEKCFNYVVSILTYIVQYQENREIVVKDMQHKKYSDKLTPNQLEKPKFRKKLKNKNNTITLKLGGTGVRYINSNLTAQHYTKPQYPVFVSGHWREQPIGKRGLGLTKSIWIKAFYKYESFNNITFDKKVYQVS